MSTTVVHHLVDEEGLAELRRPRTGLVEERAEAPDAYVAERGPVHEYRRELVVERSGERFAVGETIHYRLATRYWTVLFALPFRRAMRRGQSRPFWAPPSTFDARSATVLSVLAAAAVVAGYLGTLVGQTMAFAAEEFGSTDTEQGVGLAVVRVGIVIALMLVALADRRGRRPVLLATCTVGLFVVALGSLSPSLGWLVASQILARSFSTAAAIIIVIVAAEELPAGSRGYGTSLIAMSGAFGVGIAVMALPLADIGVRSWRLLYVIPLLAVPLVRDLARHLPETKRFEARVLGSQSLRGHRRRFWLLATAGFLHSLLVAPAAQFKNRYLQNERGYSASRISLFTLATNTPGGIAVAIGGKLADRQGRRWVAGLGLAAAAVTTAAIFLTSGHWMWIASTAAALATGAAAPSLAVFGPELFPTSLRGRANGLLSLTALAGSVTGLVGVALLARGWELGPSVAVMAVGPLAAALLIITSYPETARLELEDLNPADRVLADVKSQVGQP